MRSPACGSAVLTALALSSCSIQHYQSDFGNAAAESQQFLKLFWIFLSVCTVMYILVIAFLAAGILRRRDESPAGVVESANDHQSHPAMRSALLGWSILVGCGLIALAIASFFADRSMAKAAAHEKLSLTITANQWWWDVQYNSGDPSKIMRTANEIHLPVGVPVRIMLQSNDVIHSFWVPSLAGKQDLIPGRLTDITIVPKKIGIYRGQCAEFCGVQHAHMALVIDVDSYADFIKWWDHQLEEAPPPSTPLVAAGYHYVTTRECASCHNIAGTPATGNIGPDLTHLASRRTIAAGTMPMSTGNLYGWVEDPQSIKPGNHMPTIGLAPADLHAVVAYLESLK